MRAPWQPDRERWRPFVALGVAALAIVTSSPAVARADTTLTFDTDTPGAPPSPVAGVTLPSTLIVVNDGTHADGTPNLGVVDCPEQRCPQPLEIDFAPAVGQVSMLVGYAGIPPSSQITLTPYTASGPGTAIPFTFGPPDLDSKTVPVTTPVAVTGSGITRVDLAVSGSTTSEGIAIDDLTFVAEAPAGAPDLVIHTPRSHAAGRTLTVAIPIGNTGSAASTVTSLAVSAPGWQAGRAAVQAIGTGAMSTVRVALTIPARARGTDVAFVVRVTAPSGETNTGNDSLPFTVHIPAAVAGHPTHTGHGRSSRWPPIIAITLTGIVAVGGGRKWIRWRAELEAEDEEPSGRCRPGARYCHRKATLEWEPSEVTEVRITLSNDDATGTSTLRGDAIDALNDARRASDARARSRHAAGFADALLEHLERSHPKVEGATLEWKAHFEGSKAKCGFQRYRCVSEPGAAQGGDAGRWVRRGREWTGTVKRGRNVPLAPVPGLHLAPPRARAATRSALQASVESFAGRRGSRT